MDKFRLVASAPSPNPGFGFLSSRFSLVVVHGRATAGFLRALGIRWFVLPPRRPQLNGHVERMQRTFRDAFYPRPLPTGMPGLQAELEAYLEYYNRRRPQMALGGLAPLEYLARRRVGGPQRVSNVLADYT